MGSAFVDCHGTSQLLGLHDPEFCGQETNPDDSGRHADGSQGGQKPRSHWNLWSIHVNSVDSHSNCLGFGITRVWSFTWSGCSLITISEWILKEPHKINPVLYQCLFGFGVSRKPAPPANEPLTMGSLNQRIQWSFEVPHFHSFLLLQWRSWVTLEEVRPPSSHGAGRMHRVGPRLMACAKKKGTCFGPCSATQCGWSWCCWANVRIYQDTEKRTKRNGTRWLTLQSFLHLEIDQRHMILWQWVQNRLPKRGTAKTGMLDHIRLFGHI